MWLPGRTYFYNPQSKRHVWSSKELTEGAASARSNLMFLHDQCVFILSRLSIARPWPDVRKLRTGAEEIGRLAAEGFSKEKPKSMRLSTGMTPVSQTSFAT